MATNELKTKAIIGYFKGGKFDYLVTDENNEDFIWIYDKDIRNIEKELPIELQNDLKYYEETKDEDYMNDKYCNQVCLITCKSGKSDLVINSIEFLNQKVNNLSDIKPAKNLGAPLEEYKGSAKIDKIYLDDENGNIVAKCDISIKYPDSYDVIKFSRKYTVGNVKKIEDSDYEKYMDKYYVKKYPETRKRSNLFEVFYKCEKDIAAEMYSLSCYLKGKDLDDFDLISETFCITDPVEVKIVCKIANKHLTVDFMGV